jgi:hypothetical protein
MKRLLPLYVTSLASLIEIVAGSDSVLVDMFASFCTGREDAKGTMKIAERQLQRIYR